MKESKQATSRSKFETFKEGIKALVKEITINKLADYSEVLFQWVRTNWKVVFVPIILFLWGAIVEFAKSTYSITGYQIIISIGFATLLIAAILNASKIRKWIIKNQDKYFEYHGFYWKKDEKDSVLGPYCKNCGTQMNVAELVASQNMAQIIDEMFGEEITYQYKCSHCQHEHITSMPIDKIKKNAQKELKNKHIQK